MGEVIPGVQHQLDNHANRIEKLEEWAAVAKDQMTQQQQQSQAMEARISHVTDRIDQSVDMSIALYRTILIVGGTLAVGVFGELIRALVK